MHSREHKSLWISGTFTALLALVVWISHPIVHAASSGHSHHGHSHDHDPQPQPHPEQCQICLAGQNLTPELISPVSAPLAPIVESRAAFHRFDAYPLTEFFSPTRSPRAPPASALI